MDNAELARLLYLCARTPGSMSVDAEEELRDLAKLAVCELKELRSLLASLQDAMKRAAMEEV